MAHSSPPSAAPGSSEEGGFQLDWRPAVEGLKRFWYLIPVIGLPLGAAGAYGAWMQIPAPYSTKAELYMRSYDDRIAFKTNEAKASFGTRKQTILKRIRSRDVLTAALRNPAVAETPTLRDLPDPVAYLQQGLNVGSAGTEFITIGLSGEKPADLPVIVNGVVDAFMSEVVTGSMEDRERKLAELRDVFAKADDSLEMKRKQYAQFVEASGSGVASTVMAEQRHAGLQELRTMLRGEIARTDLELIRERAKRSYRDSSETSFDLGEAQLDALVTDSPEYREAQEAVAAKEKYVGSLEKNKGRDSTSPTLAAARAEVESRRARLAALRTELAPRVEERLRGEWEARDEAGDRTLDETIARLESFGASLRQQLEENKVEEQTAGAESVGLRRMEAEMARKEGLVELLATEAERREFEISNATAPISVQEEAIVPRTRDTGKRLKTAVMAGGGGVGLSVALAAALGMLFTNVQRTQDLKSRLSIDLFGTLPLLPRGGAGGAGRAAKWGDALKESVDAARMALLRKLRADGAGTDGGGRVLLVSSAVAAEGKTTLSCHLAASLARTGRRVVLVDADLRRPAVHQVFGCESGPGLADVLRGEADPADVEITVRGSDLRLVPAGRVCETALAGLGTAAIAEYLADLRVRFDIVVVDSPPVLPVADGLILADHVDGVLFAVRRGVTRLRNVAAALARFEATGVTVVGAVAIGMDDETGRYGYAAGRYAYSYAKPPRLANRPAVPASKI